MFPRWTTGEDHARTFEKEFPEEDRIYYLGKGDWRGPTFFWNMQERYHSHTVVVEVFTKYKAVPEFWPPEYHAQTDYWEIVPADHPDGEPTHTPREHIGSWCNEAETKYHLRRLQQAQHRVKIILIVKALQSFGARPETIALAKARLFDYPPDDRTGPLGH